MEAEGRDILSSHGGISEKSWLLCCNRVSLSEWLATFRGTVVSSRSLTTPSHPED
jgi:hypothetical protein